MFAFDDTKAFSPPSVIDILYLCGLVSDGGMRGHISRNQKHNVIFDVTAFWNLHLNYLFKVTTVKTCLLLPALSVCDTSGPPRPGSRTLFVISAAVAGC